MPYKTLLQVFLFSLLVCLTKYSYGEIKIKYALDTEVELEDKIVCTLNK